MTDILIALGCSFTYGEGLSYELISQKYNSTYEYLKTMDNHSKIYQYMFNMDVCYKEFDKYRTEKNYPNVLKNLLNVELFTNGENGGSNITRMFYLDMLIKFLEREPDIVPKYCVFQMTHSGRDMEEMIKPNGNQTIQDDLLRIYGKNFYDKVNKYDMGKKNIWGLDNLFDEANHLFIEKLIEKFQFLENKYNTKCLFYMGLGDYNAIKSTYKKYTSYPYFFELENNDVIYYTQLQMINELGWTLDSSIGLKDSHPNSMAHKWLAEKLHNKFLK